MLEQKNNLHGSGLFPLFCLWFRLPGFLAWIATCSGIISATFIRDFVFDSQSIIHLFYIFRLISSTLSIFILTVFSNKFIRFVTLFVLALFQFILRANEQSVISAFVQKQQKENSSQVICGKIVSYPVPFRNGCMFLLKCDSASFDSVKLLRGKLIRCISEINPVSTTSVKVFGKCYYPAKPDRDYEFNESRYLLANNIWSKMDVDSLHILSTVNAMGKIAEHFRERVYTVLDRLDNPAHRGILQATFLGEVGYLSSEIKNSFRKSGIYHLLSISGLHASMIMAATYFFLIFFPVTKNCKHIIAMIVLWLYLFFIGFIPSLFRATIMATFIIGSFLFQKKNYSIHSIGIAGTLWLLYSPESLFLPGFQLSFFATIGIIAITPVLDRFCPKVSSPIINFLISRTISIFNVSFSGFLSTLPILIYHFGSISVFGLVANLAAVGIMSICMWAFFMSLLFESLINFLSVLTINVSAITLDFLIWLSRLADRFPWSSVYMSIPYPETIFFYALFLTGLITIAKKHIVTYLKWSIPLFLLIIPANVLLKTHYDEIYIERFNSDKYNTIAFCWPNKGVWIISDGPAKTLKQQYNILIKNWIHHTRYAFLEKVYILNKDKTQKIIEINPDYFDSTSEYKHKSFRGIRNDKKASAIKFFTNSSDSPSILIEISNPNNWIKCTLTDSTLLYSTDSNPIYKVSSFPFSIKISSNLIIK